MKIAAIETLRLDEFPNLLWIRIETDSGVWGVGETYFGAKAVEAYVHETAAPALIGRDPLSIERINRDLMPYVGYQAAGVEMRGISAIDVALWDLFGRHADLPVWQLLGGLCRPKIRTYNTCAGYRYVRSNPDWSTEDWGLDEQSDGPYEDLNAFLNHADALAESLLDQGISAMKIWPFDYAAAASDGYYISSSDLDRALEPFRKIRAAVGSQMDIMVELHGLWRYPAAIKIASALQEFDVFWIEDPLRADSIAALAEFASRSSAPVCASETLAGHWSHRELLEAGASAIVMPDIVWCGGLTTARRIAALADAWHRPVAPHDCTGPIAFMAAVHLSLATPNAFLQESVRAFYTGWYKELAEGLPLIEDGYILPPDRSGLGIDLVSSVRQRSDCHITVSD